MSIQLVVCPVCQKQVSQHKINTHLDIECGKGKNKNPSASIQMQMSVKRPLKQIIPETSHNLSTNIPELINAKKQRKAIPAPLADRIRPSSFCDLFGQASFAPDSDLLLLMEKNLVPNLIFFGPPGSGKTTSAKLIAKLTPDTLFLEYSATVNNIQDIKAGALKCLEHFSVTGKKGIIFVDEIHRFTKAQQDIFLQSVERGEYSLISATTENPSFRLNNALLSRCRIVVFHRLELHALKTILNRAISLEYQDLNLPDSIVDYIARFADGDARVALNTLEMVAQTSKESNTAPTLEIVKKSYLRAGVLYDRNGEEVKRFLTQHYTVISALHKSMRGGDANASLYWLGRMIFAGEDPLYVARRLIRFASEDVGLADNNALTLAMSTFNACQVIGMPECDAILAHCVAYLARCEKSVETYKAIGKVKACIELEPNYPVPMHIRNSCTELMKELGYGEGYKYNPDYKVPIDQEYLPRQLLTREFFTFAPSK